MKESNLKNSSATDWKRIDNLTDETIDTSDIPPLDADFFSRADLHLPHKSNVTLSVDDDVWEWFRSQGSDCQEKMNAALRIYAEAHKRAA
jgi:uncharacterized protein (DUF4415 family)